MLWVVFLNWSELHHLEWDFESPRPGEWRSDPVFQSSTLAKQALVRKCGSWIQKYRGEVGIWFWHKSETTMGTAKKMLCKINIWLSFCLPSVSLFASLVSEMMLYNKKAHFWGKEHVSKGFFEAPSRPLCTVHRNLSKVQFHEIHSLPSVMSFPPTNSDTWECKSCPKVYQANLAETLFQFL